ncbi:Hypothetical predicted protein, partial [Paramuricea clavata]
KSENISFEGASGKDLAERITSLLTRADDERVKTSPVEADPVKSIENNEGCETEHSEVIDVNESRKSIEINEAEPAKSIQVNEGCETEHSEVIGVNESRESNGASNCNHAECQCPEIVAELKEAEHQSVIDDMKLKAAMQVADIKSEIGKLSAEHQSVIKDQNLKYAILEQRWLKAEEEKDSLRSVLKLLFRRKTG